MNEYYSKYKEIHIQVNKACECILSNSCTKLKEEIQEIKSTLDRIIVSEWEDTAGEKFRINQSECATKLSIIIVSITSVFQKSEEIYNNLKEQLDNLNIVEQRYKEVYSDPPKLEKVSDYNESGEFIGYVYNESLYKERCKNWENAVKDLETQCETCITIIEEYLSLLDDINQTPITIAGSMQSVLNTIPSVFIPTNVTYNSGIFKRAENLTTYKYNNDSYLVIDTPGIDYAQIPAIHGKQLPDKCNVWSDYYANDIYSHSESEPIVTTLNSLISEDKQEILSIMASEFLAGRPSIIHVTGKRITGKYGPGEYGDIYSRHFVTVAGIKEGADFNNLKESDFLIMDPTSATLKPLATDISGYTTRYMLDCANATYRSDPSNKGYALMIYNEIDDYVSDTCRKAKL